MTQIFEKRDISIHDVDGYNSTTMDLNEDPPHHMTAS